MQTKLKLQRIYSPLKNDYLYKIKIDLTSNPDECTILSQNDEILTLKLYNKKNIIDPGRIAVFYNDLGKVIAAGMFI